MSTAEPSAPARLLVISCPSWPAVALGGDRSRALAVVEKGRILAATPAAFAAGVRVGQRRREAAWNCPLLEIATRDEGAERRAFLPALDALDAFGAAITVGRPGLAWIATRDPARYFGGEAPLATAVAAALRALGGTWSGGSGLVGGCFGVGIGDGVFVATRAAAEGSVIDCAATVRFLAPLPVSLLGQPELADLLGNLGITTLGEFAALDRADVLARFGWEGARVHQIASGVEAVTALVVHGREVDGEAVGEIDPPAALAEEVVFVARRLAQELCERIRAAGLAFSLLGVTVETEGGDVSTRRWSHDGPFTSALVIERVRWQLEGWMAPQQGDETSQLIGGVISLRLAAEELISDGGRQEGFWERGGAREGHVVQAFARVQGMLGPDGVLQGTVVGGRNPSDRITLRPFGDRLASGVLPVDRPWPGQIPSPSPSLVFDPPLPLDVIDAAGHGVRVDGRGELSGAPVAVDIGGRRSIVTGWAGPWPVDERWWDERHRRRARFQLVVDAEVYLVALDQGSFILEGKYD